MSGSLRVVDSGLRGARENLSLTAALAELHRMGGIADTLRFQHFRPAAIVGRHQVLAREVDLDACKARGVETARRMTGGGAIYMGPGLLGWELVITRSRVPGPLDNVSRTLCEGLARGLSGLGIDARYRPRNDVEVGGRKISGTGGYIDGGTLIFQGTVLVDFDVADMAAVLRLPVSKLDRKGIAVLADRVTSLRALTGQTPPLARVTEAVTAGLAGAIGAEPIAGAATADEEALARRLHDAEIGTDGFVHGDGMPAAAEITVRHQTAGGLVEAAVRLRAGREGIVERAWITGDMFVTPPRAIPDLEAALAGVPIDKAPEVARGFLERSGAQMLGAASTELADVLVLCWEEHVRQTGGTS